jgi:hypothetical protein
VFFDNYFTFVKPLRHLALEGTCAVGTWQDTRTEEWPLKIKVNMKSKQKGPHDLWGSQKMCLQT